MDGPTAQSSGFGRRHHVIAKFKKEHVIPSEMEKISIPKVLLEKADKELVVSVKEDVQ